MIPDSVAVVLLLLLVAAVVYIRHMQAVAALAYLEGYLHGNKALCYTNLQQTSQTGDVYDWERDGL